MPFNIGRVVSVFRFIYIYLYLCVVCVHISNKGETANMCCSLELIYYGQRSLCCIRDRGECQKYVRRLENIRLFPLFAENTQIQFCPA